MQAISSGWPDPFLLSGELDWNFSRYEDGLCRACLDLPRLVSCEAGCGLQELCCQVEWQAFSVLPDCSFSAGLRAGCLLLRLDILPVYSIFFLTSENFGAWRPVGRSGAPSQQPLYYLPPDLGCSLAFFCKGNDLFDTLRFDSKSQLVLSNDVSRRPVQYYLFFLEFQKYF